MGFTSTITPYKLSLDFKKNKLETINITQYDKDGRTIVVTCYDNSVKTAIDKLTISAKVKWLKPDNLPVFNACTVNDDGTITIAITEQMSITNGVAYAELMLLEATTASVLHTMPFQANIIKGTFTNDTVSSVPEFQALTDTLTKVEACTTALDSHIANKANPHAVTKAQINLGNVQNLAPADMPLSTVAKNVTCSVYSASATYAVGDYCLYNDVLYKCTTAITVAEAWTVSHWTSTTLDAELSKKPTCEQSLNSLGLTKVTDTMPSSYTWKAIPLPSGYDSNSIVIGTKVGDMQTSVINNLVYFEIATVAGALSIMPRSSLMYGVSYTLILSKLS